jgi:hypothetical protein
MKNNKKADLKSNDKKLFKKFKVDVSDSSDADVNLIDANVNLNFNNQKAEEKEQKKFYKKKTCKRLKEAKEYQNKL